tara:strand:+ start:170 stop:514 length:345 start_codon:yes stop_codon:yes gene_type:complete
MSLELTGNLKIVMDEQVFDSGFKKREFVITTLEEEYPQDIKFELIKDKCSDINKFKVGDLIKVHMNIRGNEYKDKYYVNLQAWRIEADTEHTPALNGDMANQFNEQQEEEDLPF